ncbi:hypothetical protein AAVH_23428 [Aphelenchoides avenae]|nr:hypothetical protein AAVH_23428 [Aphelenchus avenae]
MMVSMRFLYDAKFAFCVRVQLATVVLELKSMVIRPPRSEQPEPAPSVVVATVVSGASEVRPKFQPCSPKKPAQKRRS